MRVLHSSDWHLGRSFGPVPLHDTQVAFAEWFVGLAVREQVDLVVIAGDVYDRAIPPTPSIELFRSVLQRLRAAGVVVVVIAGNHDSAERVAAYDGLLDLSGVYVRGGYGRVGEVLTLHMPDGPVDVVLLPYLEPLLEPASFHDEYEGDTGARRRRPSHHEVLERAVQRATAQLCSPRSIAVAHAFVTGSGVGPEQSESERQLVVGGTGEVSASLFEPFSYTALGHLHTPQAVGGPTVRYSGTPLAYSFSETTAKEVVLVEVDAHGTVEVAAVPVPVGRGVATITGTIDDLLANPNASLVEHFVRVNLVDNTAVIDAKKRLQAQYPWVVEVNWQPAERADDANRASVLERRQLTPIEAAGEYWRSLHDVDLTEAEHTVLAGVLEPAEGAR
jgi:exonuclease SbcD